jgi:hypothetical protein
MIEAIRRDGEIGGNAGGAPVWFVVEVPAPAGYDEYGQ